MEKSLSTNSTGPLHIVIIGLGYVGVTAAACLSAQGHKVLGVDISSDKVERINSGQAPISEPGVQALIEKAVTEGNLSASAKVPSMQDVDLVIVCVGTPSANDGSHNMGFIAESTRQIATSIHEADAPKITVAFRSTFKPGTMDELIAPIFKEELGARYESLVELVYNPEFLRESTAVDDYFNPPKIVVGTRNGSHSSTMHLLNKDIEAPVFETGFREAEITKFIDNSWHAVKVAFANEFGRVCAAYEVDARVAHEIFVADTKLNISPYYTRPGGAFGGSCLPKDVRAMQYIAKSAGANVQLINSLLKSNQSHKEFQLNRVTTAVGDGQRILVVGLAFKAGTDDMRESPNVDLVSTLVKAGYDVRVYDPVVKTSSLVGQNLGFVMTEIPNLREILLDDSEFKATDFDLVVLNNDSAEKLDLGGSNVLDLRVIEPSTATS